MQQTWQIDPITILIILCSIVLIVLTFVLYLLLSPKKETADESTLLLLNRLQQDVNSGNQQNKTLIQERLDMVLEQITRHQRATSQHLVQQHHSSTNTIKDLTVQLTQIQQTNQQILGFSKQMNSLEKILKNPKQRGILGEYFLETLLANILQPNQYKMQYKFNNNEIVDAVIFFRDTIIPIDAKFSLEKYNKIQETQDPEQKERLSRAFKNDIKKRIDETAKYIRPTENTTDFAFMFIPAEGVYYSLLIYKVGAINSTAKDLVAYAFQKKVIIVSPTSFYAYLQTVLHGLKALKVEESVKTLVKQINNLAKNLAHYEIHVEKVGKNLHATLSAYQQADKAFQKIDTDIIKITEQNKIQNKNNIST